MTFVFSIPSTPVGFVFSIKNQTIGNSGGDINIYVNGVLDQTVTTSDYSTETINIYP